uniref:F-box domain-containing protein n=1 Tax=Meloidogyne floridensis TaxID=298350 RepID=A0A915NQ43_9BILA
MLRANNRNNQLPLELIFSIIPFINLYPIEVLDVMELDKKRSIFKRICGAWSIFYIRCGHSLLLRQVCLK